MRRRFDFIWMGICVVVFVSCAAFVAITFAPRDEPSVEETVTSTFEPSIIKVDDSPASARVRYVSFDGTDLCLSLGFGNCFGCHVAARALGVNGAMIGSVEHDVVGDELSEFDLRVPVGENGWFEVASVEVDVKGATLQECDVNQLVMDVERAIADQLGSESAALIDVSKSGMLERREADKAAAERARQELAEAKRRAEEEARERARREEEDARRAAQEYESEVARRAAEDAGAKEAEGSQVASDTVPAMDTPDARACDIASMRGGGQDFVVVIDVSSNLLYGCGNTGGTWSVGRKMQVLSLGSFGVGESAVLRKAPDSEEGSYDGGDAHKWFVALSERFIDGEFEEGAGRYLDGYGWWYATGICSGTAVGDGNAYLSEDDARWLYTTCDVGTPIVLVGSL